MNLFCKRIDELITLIIDDNLLMQNADKGLKGRANENGRRTKGRKKPPQKGRLKLLQYKITWRKCHQTAKTVGYYTIGNAIGAIGAVEAVGAVGGNIVGITRRSRR